MAETKTYLVKKSLPAWLEKQHQLRPDQFPTTDGPAYPNRYMDLASYLDDRVLKHVNVGALLSQLGTNSAQNDVMLLTDHGPEHIRRVIERASDVLRETRTPLSPYEGFLLLAAIHLHDTGNVYGRDEHMSKVMEVIQSAGVSVFFADTVEKRIVARIASAHSGVLPDGSSDTISALESSVAILGFQVRTRFLAALLRFADELSDDRSRASRFLDENQLVPDSSRIYHQYSFCLHSVSVDEQAVKLGYEILKSNATVQFEKDGERTWLLDEVYRRIYKVHRERMYCMRFWPNGLGLRSVEVTIDVAWDPVSPGVNGASGGIRYIADPIRKIGFDLFESGYPDAEEDCNLCTTTESELGIPAGSAMAEELSNGGESGNAARESIHSSDA